MSPSFDELLQIWQVVYYANMCYMVSFTEGSDLHLFLASSKGKSRDDSFAMIYRENNFQFKFLLGVEERRISMEIDRSVNTNVPKESISFIDGTYKFTDEIDREKFRFIISCIMEGCKELIKYCYKNKRF